MIGKVIYDLWSVSSYWTRAVLNCSQDMLLHSAARASSRESGVIWCNAHWAYCFGGTPYSTHRVWILDRKWETRVVGGLYGEIFQDLRIAWRAWGVRRYSFLVSVSGLLSCWPSVVRFRRRGVEDEVSFMIAIPVAVVAAPAKIAPADGRAMVAPADWSKAKRPPVAPPYMMDWMLAAMLPRLERVSIVGKEMIVG